MYDELAGWVKNFNRYNSGSESEFWMSVFNHKVAMSDRKSSQSGVFIRNPFLCVIGTIQPKVLTDLSNDGSRRVRSHFGLLWSAGNTYSMRSMKPLALRLFAARSVSTFGCIVPMTQRNGLRINTPL